MTGIKEIVRNSIEKTTSSLNKKEAELLAEQLGKTIGDILQDKKKQLDHAREISEEKIKEHPLSYVSAAFAAGIVIGMILRK